MAVSDAGDINGDGISDLLISATNADPDGRVLAGQVYVVFGSVSGFEANFNLAGLDGETAL